MNGTSGHGLIGVDRRLVSARRALARPTKKWPNGRRASTNGGRPGWPDDVGEGPEAVLLPTQEEVDAWAEEERRRRRAWLAGPTENEKRRWIRKQTGRFWEGMSGRWEPDRELVDSAERLLRDAELAAKGSIDVLLRAPFALWSYLVRSGRRFEQEGYEPPPRRRVRF
jgi:hypothetical protein